MLLSAARPSIVAEQQPNHPSISLDVGHPVSVKMKLAISAVAAYLVLAVALLTADTRAFSPGRSIVPSVRLHAPSSLSIKVVRSCNSWQHHITTSPRKIRTTISSSSALAAASSSSSSFESILSDETTKKVASTSLLIVMDVAIRRLFKKYAIAFPSSLAGCGFLFATLLGINAIKTEWGDSIYNILAPGAAVLAKWLPVFFVPSLVTLPLAQSFGNGVELAKVAAVIVGGFFFTLFTTAGSVLAVRKLLGGGTQFTTTSTDESLEPIAEQTPSASPPLKAFSDSTAGGLTTLAATSGILAAVATRAGSSFVSPLQSVYMLFTTLATFVFGARLPKTFKIVHPLVTCTSLTWLGAKLMTFAAGGTFRSMLKSYKRGTLAPMLAGAGDVLLFMLGPAVVALACQMYDRKKLMRENIAEVGTSVGVSAFGGLFGTAAMVRLLSIADPTIRLCLLSRNITSPLAMAIASIVGADVSLAVSMVVITGLVGANFGASILNAVRIKDSVARGLGIGAAAHGLGTAAFANEKDAFPFAAISMALTGALTTVLVSLPAVKKAALNLALGV